MNGRRGLAIAGGLVVAVLVVVGVAAARFDADAWRPEIVRAVDRATGRDLTLAGPIGLGFSLWPTVAANDVTLTDPHQTVSVARVEARLALWPLLSRRVEIAQLRLVRPKILLGVGAGAAPPPPPPPPIAAASVSPTPGPALAVFVRSLRIEDGEVRRGQGDIVEIQWLDANAATDTAPVAVDGNVSWRGTVYKVTGEVGAVGRLREAGVPWPVHLDIAAPGAHATVDGSITDGQRFAIAAAAAGATLSAQGTLAAPYRLTNLDMALSARIPDLAALGALAQTRLPRLTDAVLAAKLTLAPGLVAVHDVVLTTRQGDVRGDGSFATGRRPLLRATAAAHRLDADAIIVALLPRAEAPRGAAPVAGSSTTPSHSPARLIPDAPLPFALLRGADADVTLRVDELVAGGAVSRDLSGHLTLADGKLAVAPFAGQLPGGRLDGALRIDAGAATPPVALSLRAPGLAMKPLLAAWGLPDDDAGALEVDADLRGNGASLHAIAAGLDGHLGLAMVDGGIDNRLIAALFAPLTRAFKLPSDLAGGTVGQSHVRCLAIRLDAHAGTVAAHSFLLDTTRLRLEASGTLALGDETLDLTLHPLLRLSQTGVAVPLHLGGTLRDPRARIDAAAAAAQAGGALAAGKNTAFSIILGALTAPQSGNDACGEQLAAARGGRAGPLPADPPAAAAGKPKPPKAADLLRELLK